MVIKSENIKYNNNNSSNNKNNNNLFFKFLKTT